MKRALAGVVIGALALAGCSSAASGSAPAKVKPKSCAGYVGLTIDDGPTVSTGDLLTILRAYGATATFFNVGAQAQKYPDAVKAEAAIGQVGNHTYSHGFLDQLTDKQAYGELLGTNQIIESLTGTAPILFRPPFDRVNASTEGIAQSLGMTTVLWNIDTRDYVVKNEMVKRFAGARAGDIILIHDGVESTRTMLPKALDQLNAHKLCTGRVVPSTTPHFAWHTEKFGDITFDAKVVPPSDR
jgi:peptidoglycan-N-acetylglucosamine deacetylase